MASWEISNSDIDDQNKNPVSSTTRLIRNICLNYNYDKIDIIVREIFDSSQKHQKMGSVEAYTDNLIKK